MRNRYQTTVIVILLGSCVAGLVLTQCARRSLTPTDTAQTTEPAATRVVTAMPVVTAKLATLEATLTSVTLVDTLAPSPTSIVQPSSPPHILSPTFTPFPIATSAPIPPGVQHTSPFAAENIRILEVIDLQAQLLADPARLPVDEGRTVKDITFRGWSPDGQYILLDASLGEGLTAKFDAAGTGGKAILGIDHVWVMEADGDKIWEVASNGNTPRCSPDGRWIAYTRLGATQDGVLTSELWASSFDGSVSRRLSREGQPAGREGDWVDNETFLFVSGTHSNEIQRANVNATETYRVELEGIQIDDQHRISILELAPDRRTIAIQIPGKMQIGTLSDDYQRITFFTEVDIPDYSFSSRSPDSQMLAIYPFPKRDRPHSRPLRVLRTDGSEVFRLEWPNTNQPATWSPDGQALIFDPRGPHIYVVNADGTGARALLESPPVANWFYWSPDGQYIGFNRDNQTGAALLRLQLAP